MSPTLLNVVVNSVVRHWILMAVEYKAVIQNGLGHAVGQILGVFYADDGLLVSRYPEWLQGALNGLIRMFCQIGLVANISKSKTMACHLGEIILGISEEVFGRRSTGKGETYWEWLRRKIRARTVEWR